MAYPCEGRVTRQLDGKFAIASQAPLDEQTFPTDGYQVPIITASQPIPAATFSNAPSGSGVGTGRPRQSVPGTVETTVALNTELDGRNHDLLLASLFGIQDNTIAPVTVTDAATSGSNTLSSTLTDLSVYKPGTFIVMSGLTGTAAGANYNPLLVLTSSTDVLTVGTAWGDLGTEAGPMTIELYQPRHYYHGTCDQPLAVEWAGNINSVAALGARPNQLVITGDVGGSPATLGANYTLTCVSPDWNSDPGPWRFFTTVTPPEDAEVFTVRRVSPGTQGIGQGYNGLQKLVTGGADVTFGVDTGELALKSFTLTASTAFEPVVGVSPFAYPLSMVKGLAAATTWGFTFAANDQAFGFLTTMRNQSMTDFGFVVSTGESKLLAYIPQTTISAGSPTIAGTQGEIALTGTAADEISSIPAFSANLIIVSMPDLWNVI